MPTPRQKMAAGDWYSCIDPELDALRHRARLAVHEHNSLSPDLRGSLGPKLASLLGHVGKDVFVEAPFHCAYGFNIRLEDGVYLNAGVCVLDTAPVVIGAGSMLGPAVQIYCAQHDKDPARRAQGLEVARPITLGTNVWVGGAAVLLPGVSIGNDAIVGAGAVVTQDVAPGTTVAGNPAKRLR